MRHRPGEGAGPRGSTRLGILRGNHDVELHYEGVQAAFRAELGRCYDAFLERAGDPARALELAELQRGLVFSDWFYFEKDLLWIEHGSQYAPVNSFECWLCPLLPEGRGARDRKDEIGAASRSSAATSPSRSCRGLRREGGLEMRLMEWHDATGEPRLLKLFDGAEGGSKAPPAAPAEPGRTAAA